MQEQELQKAGFYAYKWRQYMPDVGRFFNVDPLAEKYTHNSTYAFSENRVIDGRELEGLEWVSSRNLEDKTVNLHLTYKPINNTMGALSKEQMSTLTKEREAQIVSSFGGTDSNGNTVNISFSQSDKATISWEYNMAYDFSGVEGNDKLSANSRAIYEAMAGGVTDKIGDTQNNKTQINVGLEINMEWNNDGTINFNNSQKRSDVAVRGSHEDGHVLGLQHSDNEVQKDPKNLLRPTASGSNVSPVQRTQVINQIEEQQKKLNNEIIK